MSKKYNTLISPEEFIQIYSRKDIVILDTRFYLDDLLRGRKEYIQSHVPGAVYLDITHDLSSPVVKGLTGRHPIPDPEVLAFTFRAAGINHSSQVIVYDQSNGAYASRAWWLLRWLGYEDVAVVDGGFAAWITLKGPLDNQWPLPSPGNFESQLQLQMHVDLNDLEHSHQPLIDSREYRRFTGEYEPIDPVAGHIPGAVCIPYMENTDATGKWKTTSELKDRFRDINGSQDGMPVFYCGSGVTACHNILAYKIATGKDAKLYSGSWSEWILYNKLPARA
ncbi:MAG TPA: sulfurtransferase [Saprospiraceae bacterium]|nr:sulfurtransferase [Saprospiraceae bacterium]